ncbi:MAG: hypothetical protein JWM34_1614 [Ilumatobacteraceae bacterium]|nr:hypothetical protein [Ilumatobacteraceae bacterium]
MTHDVVRFLDAQRSIYETVVSELRSGRKQSHWMWFVFPQIAGLGTSAMSRRYAIAGLDEASAYLDHTLLRARLEECTTLVVAAGAAPLEQVLGRPDDLKFHSSMSLFAQVARHPAIIDVALQHFFGGAVDPATLSRL